MTKHRMKWMIPAVLGTLVSGLAVLAFQTPRVDDKALKNAAKGTEWLSYGMDYSEQRYSTATQINTTNVGKLAAGLVLRSRKRRWTAGGNAALCQWCSLRHHQLEHHVRSGCDDRQGDLALRSRRPIGR